MKTILRALLAVSCLMALMTGPVAGYDVPIDKQISLSGVCTSGENLRATVVDSNGKPLADQTVTWVITSSPSSADQLRDDTTTTDANGVTTNSVDLDTSVTGRRVITVTARDASATIELNCGSGGLPRTDTAPSPVVPLLTLLALAVLVAAAGLLGRRART